MGKLYYKNHCIVLNVQVFQLVAFAGLVHNRIPLLNLGSIMAPSAGFEPATYRFVPLQLSLPIVVCGLDFVFALVYRAIAFRRYPLSLYTFPL